MQSIVALFWRIATFRSGPEAIPFSTFLATTLVVINILSATIFQQVFDDVTLLRSLTTAIVSLAATAALVWSLMWVIGKKERYTQTFTALVGTDLLITIVQAVLFPLSQLTTAAVTTLVAAVTVFWTIGVFGYIFHKALDVHIAIGVATALFLLLLSVSITQTAVSNL